MNFEIKKLEQPAVLEILTDNDLIFTPPHSTVVDLHEYSQKLATHAYFNFCYVNDTLAGVIAFYKNEDTKQIYIPYLLTRTEFQGKGVASAMLKHIDQTFHGHYTTIALEVNKTNLPAFRLYSKMNFIINEDRGNKYLMVRSL